VFWTASVENARHEFQAHLFMRDTASGYTLELDRVQSGSGVGVVEPRFQVASGDGSRVFFTDTQALTASSAHTAHRAEDGDLYECEIVEAAGKPGCRLSDLTPVGGGGSADVQGLVIGVGGEGAFVYFVATGVLSGSPDSGGQVAVAGGDNLYVRAGGVTSLVAVLSPEDAPDWGSDTSGGLGGLPGLTARVSPDGQWLAFMSERELTGYDNEDVSSRAPGEKSDEEVFEYHAPQNLEKESGTLTCASCDPTGARPAGEEYGTPDTKLDDGLVGGDRVWGPSQWIAGNVPGWTPFHIDDALYQSRYLSNEGRLFFNSSDALVPSDINGQEDVYEYEPAGIKSPEGKVECSESTSSSSEVFKPARSFEVEGHKGEQPAGCVGLISSGSASGESAFLDASETGGDVFFLTYGKLSPQDYDDSLDVYDAHECTAEAKCFPPAAATPPPCETEASCKAAPEPQPGIFGSPSSATFSGPGNLTPSCSSGSSSSSGSGCGSKPPPGPSCSSSLGAPSTKCTKKQNLTKALATCKRKYPHNKKKHASCEATARHKYAPKPAHKKK
jgi:hypothetical protein